VNQRVFKHSRPEPILRKQGIIFAGKRNPVQRRWRHHQDDSNTDAAQRDRVHYFRFGRKLLKGVCERHAELEAEQRCPSSYTAGKALTFRTSNDLILLRCVLIALVLRVLDRRR
jgi:hypothetical protein